MKETHLDLINYCLQGITDCIDMINLFQLLKMKHLCKSQRGRLKALMESLQHLNYIYVNRYAEVPRVSVSSQKTFVSATAEDVELSLDALNIWINWETKVQQLCSQILDKGYYTKSEQRVFKHMLYCSQVQLKLANCIKQKCFGSKVPIENINGVKQNIQPSIQKKIDVPQK